MMPQAKPALIILASLAVITMCSREWKNPYDPGVSPSLWSPSELRIQSVDENSLDLSWDPVADVEVGYRIQRATFGTMDSLGEFSDVLTTRTTAVSDNSLSSSTGRYVYRLTAQAEDRISEPAPDRLVSWTAQGELLWQASHEGEVRASNTDADGKLLLAATSTGQVRIWDLEARIEGNSVSPLLEITVPGDLVTAALSPDGEWLVTGHLNGDVIAYSSTSGAQQWQSGHASSAGGWAQSLAISPDGAMVISAGGDKRIRAWKASNGDALWASPEYLFSCISTAFSPNGRYAAGGSMDSTFKVFNASSGSVLFSAQHAAGGDQLYFSPDNQYILSGGWQELGLWDISSGSRMWLLRNFAGSWFPKAQFIESGQKILCEDRNRLLILDTVTGTILTQISVPGSWSNETITALAIHPDRPLAYLGNDAGQTGIVDLDAETFVWTTDLAHGLSFIAFNSTGTACSLIDNYYLSSILQVRGAFDSWVTSNW